MNENLEHIVAVAVSAPLDEDVLQVKEASTSSRHRSMPEIRPGRSEAEISRPEQTRQIPSELADEVGQGSELYEYIYFDDTGHTRHNVGSSHKHEIQTAPLFTSSALQCIKTMKTNRSTPSSNFPFVSYGGLGRVLEQHNNDLVESPPGNIVFMNTNTPSTTIICGVQGSGKSHSVGVIVENSLISMRELGSLPEPLSVTVFHLSAAQGGMHLPCESAFIQKSALGVTDLEVPVYVLVSPSNLVNMRESYAKTGATVRPFYLSTKDLNCSRMLSLMHVEEGDKIPLYMEVVQQILRSMGSDAFDYRVFKREIDAKKMKEFSQQQRMPLDLRFQLLEAMLLECQKVKAKTTDSVKEYFKPGRVTIIDLTDPFINASAAAALFDIALSLYLEAKIATGKLLVLDEAHKYLTNKVSDPFVNSMFSVIRQQRHLGIRTIVSTQEPTVVPEDMIGLCSTVICHRFSSPLWWKHLKRLVPLDDESSKVDWFDRISRLKTGECIVFCPLALTAIETGHGSSGPTNLGRGCMLVKVRRKVTETSGQSVLSVRV